MAPWKRTFYSAFIAQIFSIVGFAFCFPFLPFFIAELGIKSKADQTWWAGVVMSAAGVTLALFAPVWGMLADKYGRKCMVLRAMFSGTVIMFLMSLVQTVPQLSVCRLLQGAFTGTVAASVALVAGVTPVHRSGFALGMMQAAVFIGVCLGPFFGGIVADHFGYRMAFRIGALVILVGGLLVQFGTHEEFTPPDPKRKEMHGRFSDVLANRTFLLAAFIMFAIRLSNSLTSPAFPLIVKEIHGSSEAINSLTGSIIAVAALAGAISAAVLGHFGDSWGHRKVLIACCIAAAIASFAHLPINSIAGLFVVRTIFGLSIAGMLPATNAMIRREIADHNIGKAYGAATSFSMSGLAIGPLLGGFLGGTFGLRIPFLVMGFGQIGVLALVCRMRRRQPADGL